MKYYSIHHKDTLLYIIKVYPPYLSSHTGHGRGYVLYSYATQRYHRLNHRLSRSIIHTGANLCSRMVIVLLDTAQWDTEHKPIIKEIENPGDLFLLML